LVNQLVKIDDISLDKRKIKLCLSYSQTAQLIIITSMPRKVVMPVFASSLD